MDSIADYRQKIDREIVEFLFIFADKIQKALQLCVEFDLTHPFADGNGRIGRLWHTLLLSWRNPAFAWLPEESMIYAHQQEYYAAINTANDARESTAFIEFMLSVIKVSLVDALKASDEMRDAKPDKAALRWEKIVAFLSTYDSIMNADVRALCGVSAAMANRILAGLVAEGKLARRRKGGYWAYGWKAVEVDVGPK